SSSNCRSSTPSPPCAETRPAAASPSPPASRPASKSASPSSSRREKRSKSPPRAASSPAAPDPPPRPPGTPPRRAQETENTSPPRGGNLYSSGQPGLFVGLKPSYPQDVAFVLLMPPPRAAKLEAVRLIQSVLRAARI